MKGICPSSSPSTATATAAIIKGTTESKTKYRTTRTPCDTFQRVVGEVRVDGGVGLRQILIDRVLAGTVETLGYHVHVADFYRYAVVRLFGSS